MAVHFTGPILHKGTGTSGVSPAAGWPNNMPIAVDPDYVVVMDDFTGVALDSTNDWTVVKDTGAAVAIAADTAGGVLTITSAATTDDDGGSIQGNEIFLPAAGRDIWFEARFTNTHADQNDVFVGICENFATNPEACLSAANRIGFQINDGNASILCKSEIATVETSTDSAVDLVTGTYVTVGFHVIGTGPIEFYVNRKLVATHAASPTTEMTPAVFSLSGNATGTHILSCDYVMCVATR